MTEKVDRTHVNGVEVIAVETATGEVIPGQGTHKVPSVELVMLADETTLYRCALKPDECADTFASIKSTIAHQRKHSATIAAKKAQALLAEVQAEKDAEFKRRSEGMNAANEAKRRRYAGEVTSNDKKIAAIQRKLSDLAVGVERIAATLPPLAEMIRALNQELAEITAPEAVIDPEIAEKAAAYDMLKGILNK